MDELSIDFGPQKILFSKGFALIAMESLLLVCNENASFFGNNQKLVGL